MEIRPATASDVPSLVDLLVADARARHRLDPQLWALDTDPGHKLRTTLTAAMENTSPPFRQQWLVAVQGDQIIGVTHSILLPVPPIYAGELGAPGLIMEDCFVHPDAPPDTYGTLLQAAEDDLTHAGAKILLASSVAGGVWADHLTQAEYVPLTLYFAKTGLSESHRYETVRDATTADVPAIRDASAVHRRVLNDLNGRFWKPHPDADDRFAAWMTRSLNLNDRDMFVSESGADLLGYAISQPATPLHFPAPHDISRIGVIDDYYHRDLEDPHQSETISTEGIALLRTAEAARQRRGDAAVLVVCPAAWTSKIALLRAAGYVNAITWFIKAPKNGNP